MITCEHCREALAEYALGHTDPAANAAIDEHLAACVVCRRELAEVESAWSGLALALPPATPRPEVFERLAQLIETDDGAAPRLRPRPATIAGVPSVTPRRRFLAYALAASVLGALAGGSLALKFAGPGTAPADALADQALRDLAQRLGNLQQLERMLATGNVKLASLYSSAARDQAGAYVVWDYPKRQWHFYALSLPPAPPGKTYQLWAVAGDDAPLAGPTFEVNAAGVGKAIADFPTLAPGTAVKAVVTPEPIGGSPAPTGKPVLNADL